MRTPAALVDLRMYTPAALVDLRMRSQAALVDRETLRPTGYVRPTP